MSLKHLVYGAALAACAVKVGTSKLVNRTEKEIVKELIDKPEPQKTKKKKNK